MSRTPQSVVSHVSRQKRMLCLMVSVLFCLVLVFVWGERAGAAGGDIDTSFNYGGAGANGDVFAVFVQPDGKILIGGSFTSYNGDTAAPDRIARLNTDGTLDPTFNPGGAGADSDVRAIAVQPDGKILIGLGGAFTSYNSVDANDHILRLNTDGTLDTSFNLGSMGADAGVNAVAVQPDGKILIGGNFQSYNGVDVGDYILRLNTDGTPDSSFNLGGAGASNNVNAIAVLSDGKILIGGGFQSYNGVDASDGIARLNTDGTLDTSFNPGGAGADGSVAAMVVLSDGKILIGGIFTGYNGVDASDHILRLNTDGTLDTSFNPGGAGAGDIVNAVAVQSDGKIIIGGNFTSYNDVDDNANDYIARLNTDGTLNTSFNMDSAGANSEVRAIAVQPDGKIIIGGTFTTYNDDTAVSDRIARLLPAPGAVAFSAATYSVEEADEGANNVPITLTRTDGTDNEVVGKVTLTNGTTLSADYRSPGALDTTFNQGVNNSVSSVALQPDGKIVIGGYFTRYNGTNRSNVARLNSDGSLDTSFDPGAGGNAIVQTVALQPDGKVIVGGYFTFFDGITRNRIARLNSDGSLDTSFDPGTGANSIVYAVAVQPDGKIIIGGAFTTYNGITRNHIARLNSEGSLDTSFDLGTGANGTVNTIAVQSDGKIIIGGEFTTYYDLTSRNRIARLYSDGTLDTAFNPGTGANNPVLATATQPDGTIIIGGAFTTYNGTARNRIAQLNSDGTLNPSFNPGTGADNWVRTVALQPDGKIFLGGDFTTYNGTSRNHITRLDSDGSLDTTFNPGTGTNHALRTIALQPDGKIILGGDFNKYKGTSAYGSFLVRVLGDLFVTWAAGDSSDKTIQIQIVNDSINEFPDETLNLSLSVISGGATLGSPNTAVLTILDPNNAPINTVPGAQSTAEETARVFSSANGNRISIADADASTNAVRVTLTATNGTVTLNGTGGLDFVTGGGAGDGTSDAMMSFTGTITDINAALNGLSFAPTASYSGPASLQIVTNDQGNTGTGNALSDTDTVNITVTPIADTPSVTNATTSENTKTTAGLVISRNVADTSTTTHFKITAITNGTLYQNNGTTVIANNQFITFAQANAGLKFLPAPGLSSPSSSFSFKVQASTKPVDAGLGGSIVTALITVTEGGVLKLSAATYSVGEAPALMTINVTRTGGSGGATSVKYATSNGTATGYTSCAAGKDYVTKTGTLSWAAGDMANKSFTIPICNDTVFEGNETVNLTLSNVTGAASLGTASSAVLTIVDNETQPKVSINSVMVTEGNTGAINAAFTVKLSVASSKTVTVKYQTANATALAPADYTASPLTMLTFAPGQTSKTVNVAVKGDLIDELDETFKVVLSAPTNATIATGLGTGVGTIKDNDTATISITNATVTETDAGTTAMTFTVKLSLASSRTVTVKYATANNTATAPGDYTALALTTLTFSPGQTTKTVTVQIKGELIVEPNETLFVNLSGAVNAGVADAQGQGTILNDD